MASPLDLSVDSAKPVVLPEAGLELNEGDIVTVSGWGTTSSGGVISDQLRSVDVPVVSDAVCDVAYGAGSIAASMLCAGDISNGELFN